MMHFFAIAAIGTLSLVQVLSISALGSNETCIHPQTTGMLPTFCENVDYSFIAGNESNSVTKLNELDHLASDAVAALQQVSHFM